jgi:hypothetical protein
MACEDSNCQCNLKTDGSAGTGELAKLTILRTDDVQGEVEESFVFPYNLIRFDILQLYVGLKQINGYLIKRLPKQGGE